MKILPADIPASWFRLPWSVFVLLSLATLLAILVASSSWKTPSMPLPLLLSAHRYLVKNTYQLWSSLSIRIINRTLSHKSIWSRNTAPLLLKACSCSKTKTMYIVALSWLVLKHMWPDRCVFSEYFSEYIFANMLSNWATCLLQTLSRSNKNCCLFVGYSLVTWTAFT